MTVIDDYAHHPTEIKATLEAAAHYPHRQLWCVFQASHLYPDQGFVPGIRRGALTRGACDPGRYLRSPGDRHSGISSEDLADALREKGTDVYYFPTFEEIEDFCRTNCREGDLLITMGAGNVVNIGEALLGQ